MPKFVNKSGNGFIIATSPMHCVRLTREEAAQVIKELMEATGREGNPGQTKDKLPEMIQKK